MKKEACIIVCEPNKVPVTRILQGKERTLKTYQAIVGGLIQSVPSGGPVTCELWCNEEGFLMNLPMQHTPFKNLQKVSGTYFICTTGLRGVSKSTLERLFMLFPRGINDGDGAHEFFLGAT